MADALLGTPVLSAPATNVAVAKRFVTFAVTSAAGVAGASGVIDALAGGTIPCNAGDTVAANVSDVSAGGVSSLPSAPFTIVAVNNTTVPTTPGILGITFAPAPVPAPTPTPTPTPTAS